MHRIYNLLDTHTHRAEKDHATCVAIGPSYAMATAVARFSSPPHTLLTKSTGSVTLRVLWAEPDSQSYTPAGLSNSQQSARNINTQ